MKSRLLLLLLILSTVFTACNKDEDDEKFDYDRDLLIGKWRITHIELKDGYVDITKYPYTLTIDPTYATFNSDGTFEGEGYFGDGTGTYKAIGKIITCYIDKEEYAKYEVLSLTGTICELKATIDGETIKVKCKKQ